MGVAPVPRRTIARHAAAEGEETHPPDDLVGECLNCGAEVERAFCPECGQARIDPDPTLHELGHELAEEFLHWDGKLARSYRALVARPGQLTRDYLAGRRISYISPLRTYLTCSVLFFFLSALIPDGQRFDAQGRSVDRGLVKVGRSSPAELAKLEAKAQTKPLVQRVWLQHLARGLATPSRLEKAVTSSIPKAMFVLVPLFAALLGIGFRSHSRRYPRHLTFALHEHAVLFVGLTAMLGSRFIANENGAVALQLLVVCVLAVHLVLATRAVYGRTLGSTLVRLAIVVAMYLVGFVGVLAATFALTVLEF